MFLKRKQNTWKKQSNLLNQPTRICKVCFEEIQAKSFHHLVNDTYICEKCIHNFSSVFKEFIFEGIKVLSIYEYKSFIKKKLFEFKGCYDYELYSTFLNIFELELKEKYIGFNIVFVPSNKESDNKRGFNHVEEMFKFLNLRSLDLLEKIGDDKQAKNTYFERKKVGKHIVLKKSMDLKGKKILIVDDVITTGSTLKASINLIKSLNPKEIKVLTMAKNEFDYSRGNINLEVIN